MKKIWKKMKPTQRRTLIGYVIADGYAPATAYAYCNGTRIPREHYQIDMCSYVKELTGKDVSVEKLFPRR